MEQRTAKGDHALAQTFLPAHALISEPPASRSPKELVRKLAREAGFHLCGVTRAEPLPEAEFFLEWARLGLAGEMSYLTDHRAQLRRDPRSLLPSAKSIICVAILYNGPEPPSHTVAGTGRGWISRYAWGRDYHKLLRKALERFARRLAAELGPMEWRVCVDSAPLLERAYARRAGLGWIGRNTCLIHQKLGSWLLLGELLVSLELEPDEPPPDRCGSCRRCIEACPTQALVPTGKPEGPDFMLDARRCISYLTIEHRSAIPEQLRGAMGHHVFGCDICQEVCPWNRKAPPERNPAFAPRWFAPPLEQLALLEPEDFRRRFQGTPVMRAGWEGLLRNVAVAIGNSGLPALRSVLERLLRLPSPLIREHARWADEQLSKIAGH